MTTQVASEQKLDSSPMAATPLPTNSPKTESPGKSSNRMAVIRVAAVVALIAVGFILWKFSHTPAVPDNMLLASGRIEGDDSAIASKTSGRILEVRFREGDRVNEGEVIAVLDDEQIRARERQAQASVEQAQARVRSAQQQGAVLNQQLAQNRLQAIQSGGDAAGRVYQAEADVAAAQADLVQQQSTLQLAEFDRDAYTRLAKNGAVSERQGKEAVSKADAQVAAVNASKRRVEAAQGALALAKTTLDNPAIRNTQTAAVVSQIAGQQADIASARFQLDQAKSQLIEAEANRRDLTIRAPFTGSIATRTAEPGEVIAAGTAVVTMLDLGKVYLRGFVPEGQIGKLKLGQKARVYLDSNLNQALEADVARIDPQATFTPENTYFRNDRVKQVVGVKLAIRNSQGFAKPGMPADGEILLDGDVWPAHVKRQ